MSVFILFLILFYSAKIEANSNARSSLYISVQNKDFEFYKIKLYLTNIESLVSGTLGLSFSENCRIYLKENPENDIKVTKTKEGLLKIYIKRDHSLIINNRKFSSTLFKAFVLTALKLPYSKKNVRKITWFVDALTRKLDKLTFPTIYPDWGSFPGIHALLLQSYILKPKIIMNNSLCPNEGVVYKINSEADEIFLNSILTLKNGSKILVDYFKSICAGNSKNEVDVFYSVLSKNIELPKNESKVFFIKHLNDSAFKLSFNSFMPASAQYTSSAFQSACIVPYTPKNASGKAKECQLEDFPTVWGNIESPEKFARRIELKFLRLKSYAPFLLQEPINGVIKSLHEFRQFQDAAVFKKNIILYKKEFAKAVIKEIELQKLLWIKEKKHVRIPARHDYYFQTINSEDKTLSELWPELNKYLTNKFNFAN